ncbi:MAG: hypothetical protein ACFE96_19165 [Candidatus Hermodarchaeota archaeon]
MTHLASERICSDCKKIITYEEFLINHPQLSEEKARLVWNDDLLSIFCSKCFFSAPETPYRRSRYRIFNTYPRI